MATTLSFGPVSMTWPWDYELVAQPSNKKDVGPWNYSTTQLTQGTGAGAADTLYANQLSLAASTGTTLNLSSLTSPSFGNSLNFVRLKSMYFENNVAGTSTGVAIGNAAVTPFTGGFISSGTTTLTLRNGVAMCVGVAQDATAYVVSTGINLLITNSDGANAAKVNVGLVGASA